MRSFFLGCVHQKDGLEIAPVVLLDEKDTTRPFPIIATFQKHSCDSIKSAGKLQIYVRYVSRPSPYIPYQPMPSPRQPTLTRWSCSALLVV